MLIPITANESHDQSHDLTQLIYLHRHDDFWRSMECSETQIYNHQSWGVGVVTWPTCIHSHHFHGQEFPNNEDLEEQSTRKERDTWKLTFTADSVVGIACDVHVHINIPDPLITDWSVPDHQVSGGKSYLYFPHYQHWIYQKKKD